MNIKTVILIASLFCACSSNAQNFSGIYKTDQLLKRINSGDSTYVVNFWATWCKPCVQELPAFDSLYTSTLSTKTKILLVSLDFKEDLDTKVKPFLVKNKIQAECVLLDEVNGNEFVNKISPDWSGAIPATLFKNGQKKNLVEKKMHLSELKKHLTELNQ